MALFHGAGSNCESPLMRALAELFCAAGYLVLRGDLPFRQERPTGPPARSQAKDQQGIRESARYLRSRAGKVPLWLAGHSYGGRMCSMAASADPSLANGLLLLSYPLHPPRKPQDQRTAHFPALQTPVVLVHGTRDPFGSIAELEEAIQLIPVRKHLLQIEKAGHNVPPDLLQSLSLPLLLDAHSVEGTVHKEQRNG